MGASPVRLLPHSGVNRFAGGLVGPSLRGRLCLELGDDTGQDTVEYAVMLAMILVLVVGLRSLVGSNANNAFSSVASSIQ